MCVCLEPHCKYHLHFFFYFVHLQTTVMFSIFTGGRDSSFFPNPLKFDPERWKRDNTHAFAVQPFGFGSRSCYGTRPGHFKIEISMCLL